ncbi:hypothetical protein SAMN05880590_106169 [Rhizobium sp. RU35A]|nr:hypothetical protein SAMN05880590_106169 [Rhizobium sp. RU35A]
MSSLHWSGSLLHREHARNTRIEKALFSPRAETRPVFELQDMQRQTPDFSAISPRLLRELALQKYIAGDIPQDVYIALAQELPMQAVSASGAVEDLSDVTDDTEFDFRRYFQNQKVLATTLGDEDKAQTFESVLGFLRT